MDKKILIIYHKEDNDGVVSCAMMYDYITKIIPDAQIELFGADYNNLKSITSEDIDNWYESLYSKIILLDVSFNNTSIMKKIYNLYKNNFIWVDHHKPIIDESFKLKFSSAPGIRDVNNCTIINLYRYLYDFMDMKWTMRDVPMMWRILSAWDSFTFERENFEKNFVYTVNKGVTTVYNLDVDKCINFVKHVHELYNEHNEEEFINNLFSTGDIIVREEANTYKQLIENSGDFTFTVADNRTACALFKQGSSNSLIFESCDSAVVNNGIVFKRNPNTTWTVSLYNIDDNDEFHCGKYLKTKYGGGGHQGAAGCVIDEKKFINILKTKHL